MELEQHIREQRELALRESYSLLLAVTKECSAVTDSLTSHKSNLTANSHALLNLSTAIRNIQDEINTLENKLGFPSKPPSKSYQNHPDTGREIQY